MKEILENLSSSERRTLIIGAVVLSVLILYLIVWQPVFNSTEKLRQQLVSEQDTLSWMGVAAQEIKALQGDHSAVVNRGDSSLLSIVDQTARSSNLASALKRVEPKGQNEVRVRLEQASFNDVARWLLQLQNKQGISVSTITVDRQDASGIANINLMLQGS
ncbi:MAG: type II secretion system protein M [Gammaproteobacteria bacterium]|nr:type II secretion system protein M [Gammaproteobacteria bacterium]